MEPLIIAAYILVCVAIIALILLQQGKGAEMGASFGSGGSQTLFGSSGSGNLLSHATAILVTIFFLSSFGLAMMAKQKSLTNMEAGLPSAAVIQEHNKSVSDTPTVSESAPAAASDVPSLDAAVTPDVPAADIPAVETTKTGDVPPADAPAVPEKKK